MILPVRSHRRAETRNANRSNLLQCVLIIKMEAGMGDDLKVRHSIPTRVNVQPEHHIEKSTSGSEHQTESIPKATQINKEDNSTKRAEHNAAGATKQKE